MLENRLNGGGSHRLPGYRLASRGMRRRIMALPLAGLASIDQQVPVFSIIC